MIIGNLLATKPAEMKYWMLCQFAQGNMDTDSLVLKELSKLTAN